MHAVTTLTGTNFHSNWRKCRVVGYLNLSSGYVFLIQLDLPHPNSIRICSLQTTLSYSIFDYILEILSCHNSQQLYPLMSHAFWYTQVFPGLYMDVRCLEKVQREAIVQQVVFKTILLRNCYCLISIVLKFTISMMNCFSSPILSFKNQVSNLYTCAGDFLFEIRKEKSWNPSVVTWMAYAVFACEWYALFDDITVQFWISLDEIGCTTIRISSQ